MAKKTLEQIIEREKMCRCEEGEYGMKECKDTVLMYLAWGKSLYSQLEEYVKRANEDVFFNKRMVLACWELINEQ